MQKIDKNTDKNIVSKEFQMENEKMWLLVLKYSIPTIIAMLVNALYITIDKFLIGNLPGSSGTFGLSAIGLSVPIINIIMAFSQLVGIGAAVAISTAATKKDKDEAESILSNGIISGFIISILVTTIGIVFLEDILFILGANEQTIIYALPYAKISLLSTPFYMLAFTLTTIERVSGNIKIFTLAQCMAAVVKLIFAPIFIFTFGLGIAGGAYATVVAQIFVATFILIHYIKGKSVVSLKKDKFKFNPQIAQRILVTGMAPFIVAVSISLIIAMSNLQIIRYGNIAFGDGKMAVGAMTIISNILMIFYMSVIGITQGIQPIISYTYQNKNYPRFKEVYKWGSIYAGVLCLIGSVTVFFFSREVASIFTNDPLLLDIAEEGMRIFLITLPILAIQVISSNVFQAIGKAKIAIFLSALRQVILLIPLYIFLPRMFGIRGIWFVAPTADVIAIVITLVFVVKQLKEINAEQEKIEKGIM